MLPSLKTGLFKKKIKTFSVFQIEINFYLDLEPSGLIWNLIILQQVVCESMN